MSNTRTMFGFRFCAAFIVAAVFLFSWNTVALAQDAADEGDEIISDDEEFAGDDEASDAEASDEGVAAEDEEAAAEEEEAVAEDESASAEASADEGGSFDAIGDALRNVGSAIGGAVGAAADAIGDVVGGALEAIGLGGDEEVATDEPADVLDEEPEGELVPAVDEDTDVEAPATAPKGDAFALRVQIAARDIAQAIAAAKDDAPIAYEPRAFDIPERGLLSLRVTQEGVSFCITFDISEFRQSLELDAVLLMANGKNIGMTDGGTNEACLDLNATSAAQPLLIEATFR